MAFDISLVAEWEAKSWLDIKVEPGLVHQGYKRDLTSFFYPFGSTGQSQFKMRYLSLPVLESTKLFDWSVFPFIEAGPRLDLLLSKEISDAGSYERQAFEEYRSFTGGVSIGLGVDLGQILSQMNVALGGRFNWNTFDSYSHESIKIKSQPAGLWLEITTGYKDLYRTQLAQVFFCKSA